MKIKPFSPSGCIYAKPSKSELHRAIILAAAGCGACEIVPFYASDDVMATLGAVSALGAKYIISGEKLTVFGGELSKKAKIDCRESASTMRIMIAVCAALGGEYVITGEKTLMRRPIDGYLSALEQNGAMINLCGDAVKICGKLSPGRYEISCEKSSQFLSALLIALPMLEKPSEIVVNGKIASRPYAEMTVDMLRKFGCNIVQNGNTFTVPPAKYHSDRIRISGDYSSAAAFLAFGALFGDVTIRGLENSTIQPDGKIVEILREMGADVTVDGESIRAVKSNLHGITVDCTDSPDIIMILSVLGAYADGKTVIKGADRLKYKESDRAAAIVNELQKFGVDIATKNDEITVIGRAKYHSAKVDSHNDHRVAMALSVMALGSDDECEIMGHECVAKSYPSYFEDFLSLKKRG